MINLITKKAVIKPMNKPVKNIINEISIDCKSKINSPDVLFYNI